MEKNPDVLAVVGTSGYGTPMGYSNSTEYEFQGSLVPVAHKRIDYGFLEALNIPRVQGRDFSREITSDIEDGVIVNQALLRKFGLENPVGRNFSEFAKDSVNCLMFRTGDPKHLAERLKVMLEDKSILQKISQNAKKLADRDWSWEKSASKTRQTYEKLSATEVN